MVLLDATTLLLFLSPVAAVPIDPLTNLPVEHAHKRVEHLVRTLEARRTRILIPAPAMSEVLVRTGDAGRAYIQRIERSSAFRFVSFDMRAAVEVALMTRDALDGGNKRGEADGTWAKIKYDRQIVAIAKVHAVEAIYSDDTNVVSFAAKHDIPVIRLHECPIPIDALQGSLPLGELDASQAPKTRA